MSKKVGTATVVKGGISTVAKDCAVPVPDAGGSWASTRNGLDIPNGRKGTEGAVSEVTLVDIGPGEGSKVTSRGKVTGGKGY